MGFSAQGLCWTFLVVKPIIWCTWTAMNKQTLQCSSSNGNEIQLEHTIEIQQWPCGVVFP